MTKRQLKNTIVLSLLLSSGVMLTACQSKNDQVTTQQKVQAEDTSQPVETTTTEEPKVELEEAPGAPFVLSENPTSVRMEVTQQIQRAWNTCAPTTVSMMLSARGIEVSQEQLALDMGTDEGFGTHNVDAIRILNRYLFGYDNPSKNQDGYRIETITTADPNSEEMALFKERVMLNIQNGYPLYYTFNNADVYEGSSGEHNLVGTGYELTEDGKDIAYLYYIDPSYLQQDPELGGLKKITPEKLFSAMLNSVEPNYAW